MKETKAGEFTEEFIQHIDDFLQGANRLAILGIGNEDNGDDAAGLHVANLLLKETLPDWIQIYYCERVPEHFLGKLERLRPNRIIILDAANFEEIPGAIAAFSKEMIAQGYHFSTHTLSLTMLEEFLKPVVPDLVTLYIGIQPKQTEFLSEMSKECKEATIEFAQLLVERINKANKRKLASKT
ncbi:MAG: hydrogenase 3 maturation endopeptidase HyCI [Candidatus Heimdallarchaeaceae archaeon]